MDKNIIVGLGEALWDMLPEGKKIGGAPANFAYHASQFGNEAYVASSVGNGVVAIVAQSRAIYNYHFHIIARSNLGRQLRSFITLTLLPRHKV